MGTVKNFRSIFNLKLIIAFLLLLNSSCIHTRSAETKSIQTVNDSNLTFIKSGNAEIGYLIYHPTRLPLNDFFHHLRKGDYSNAFREIDITYKPANFKDEALSELVEAGFVPVYVRIRNGGTGPLEFEEKSFSITHSEGSVRAFYAEGLPREFQKFSPKAVAANVYNTGVVVIGFAALMGVLLLATHPGGPTADLSHIPALGSKDADIYNQIHTDVRIQYKNYLLTKNSLGPGQEAKGLLFFYPGGSIVGQNSRLLFQ